MRRCSNFDRRCDIETSLRYLDIIEDSLCEWILKVVAHACAMQRARGTFHKPPRDGGRHLFQFVHRSKNASINQIQAQYSLRLQLYHTSNILNIVCKSNEYKNWMNKRMWAKKYTSRVYSIDTNLLKRKLHTCQIAFEDWRIPSFARLMTPFKSHIYGLSTYRQVNTLSLQRKLISRLRVFI